METADSTVVILVARPPHHPILPLQLCGKFAPVILSAVFVAVCGTNGVGNDAAAKNQMWVCR